MPEDKSHDRPALEPERKAADAGLLFGDTKQSPPPSPPTQAAPESRPDSGEVFALVDVPEWAADWSSTEIPTVQPPRQQARAAGDAVAGASARSPAPKEATVDPSELVQETWSRWAEWGPNLIAVAAWLAVALFLAYFVFGQEFYALAFVLFIVGLLVAVVLSYPMLITLERPVRITPEQAIRDYYGALSHHVPHLRRMWLLLSTAGRVSTAFGSFEGFKGYWHGPTGPAAKGTRRAAHPARFRDRQFQVGEKRGEVADRRFITQSMSRFVAVARPDQSKPFRRRSPWCAGLTICGISKTERCRAASPERSLCASS